MKIDQYLRVIIDEKEICNALYSNPELELNNIELEDPSFYNNAIDVNYSDLNKIKRLESIEISPDQWHKKNQTNWNIPDDYKRFDVAKYVLDQCNNETELQRAGAELLVYAERNLLPMLCYLKYLVDTMKENNIVWGVGRGSSVASFVLYKIGIHRIDSIEYDLDFKEFMR